MLSAISAFLLCAQDPDPAYASLQKAYDALRVTHYDEAISYFQQAIALAPNRAAIHKDLAYTLLKIGENEAARDQFAEAMRIDPSDQHVALEYAFLCYETKQQAVARRIFDRVRKTGDATAEQAFQNIDRPLAEGIERWKKALEMSPDNFSAHQELATLAEQRDELALAAEQYQEAWRLRPDERSLLLDMGRTWKALGRAEEATAALIAASRGAQPRTAEKARELLGARYPYVYEFEGALKLDPKNLDLRRELAYLLLEMGKKDAAEQQFQIIHRMAPEDLVSAEQLRLLETLHTPKTLRQPTEAPRASAPIAARELAEKSLNAGYLQDALKYLLIAHESDPTDYWVMLKLGWTYNMLRDDADALSWFDQARSSPDAQIADEAKRAYKNLQASTAAFHTTAWFFPFFSTRWHDAFGYGQVKTEFKPGHLPLKLYISMRFIGDTKQTTGTAFGATQPQYLSEDSFIFGVGIATNTWHGATGWFEAGEAVKYLTARNDVGSAIPDYRGGISFAKGIGHLLNGSHGLFAETTDDGIFVSRFQNDMLLYLTNRTGYTLAPSESIGFQAQLYWNYNLTVDRSRQYWANFVETGPGVKCRFRALPKSMVFSVNFVRGAYLMNDGNPGKPNYFDLRAGFWYAFTR